MHRVEWLDAALAQVADGWLEADSDLRAAITTAVNQIDIELRDNPGVKGESRTEDERILVIAPLGIVFRIEHQEPTVVVLRAWVFRRGRRPEKGTE
jgi:hypothetical protein